jgi:alginate O-acetyltransferase complex protein AlgI
MLFNSLDFLVFFPLVTLIYFLLPHRFRWVHLLLASCIFYLFFIPVYILILVFTITIDYFAGIGIEGALGGRRKFFLVLSICGNLGVLAVFKYADFFIGHTDGLLHLFHVGASIPLLHLILPIGLSFHTFQAMSYTIEVYRGNCKAERHFGLYALYVLFYPQLVAGPIERPSGLLRQLRVVHVFDRVEFGAGLRLMLWGFFKKLVIADRIGAYVNYVYGHVDQVSSGYVVLAVLLFSFQIYCDFSGYSDIAIGAARTMGFRLMVNFNRPYFAADIRAFWARWHISLSTWFRDYMYIPLGGNRVSKGRQYMNIGIVFVLSGFWHGAGWNFIVWGALHGLMMIVWLAFRGGGFRAGVVRKVMGAVGVFVFVTIAWVFFRAADLGQAVHLLSHLAGYRGDVHFEANITRTGIALSLAFVVFMLLVESKVSPLLEELRGRFWPDVIFCVFVLTSILLFGVFGSQPFIYFQF